MKGRVKDLPLRERQKRIRNRKSYATFKELAVELELKPVAECLKAIYEFINERGAFGSATNARWAKESLDLLIYDMETEEYKKSIIKEPTKFKMIR